MKERTRDARIGFACETALRDLRYGFRTLRRTPVFAATVIATLALGIVASVTMFSMMRAVLWQPLPYPLADRLVLLSADARGLANAGLAAGEARDLRDEVDLFDQVATIEGVNANLDVDGELEHVMAASANDAALSLLGATSLPLGRPLEAARDVPGEFVTTVVISDRLWRSHFGGDTSVVGRRIQVNNLDVQVVGVLRPGLRVFMPADANTAEEIDVWFPRAFDGERRSRTHSTIARLRPGITLDTVQARLDVLSDRFGGHRRGAPLPGVDDVSAARPLPFEPWQLTRNVAVETDPTRPLARVTVQSVRPGYLRVMGIALREGRDISATKTSYRAAPWRSSTNGSRAGSGRRVLLDSGWSPATRRAN